MIRNDRQYKITKTEAKRFRDALLQLKKNPISDKEITIESLTAKALASQLQDLEEQILEYESLKLGAQHKLSSVPFDDLPDMLVRTRIARGMTQKDLAARLNMKEQQIQRYEATDYAGASLERIKEVITALDMAVFSNAILDSKANDLQQVIRNLETAGLPKELLFNKVLPTGIADAAQNELKNQGTHEPAITSRVVAHVAEFFDVAPKLLFSNSFELAPASSVRFKVGDGANPQKLSAYAVYAQAISNVVLRCMQASKKARYDDDRAQSGMQIRQDIINRYGELTLRATLNFIWDFGIPVIPMDDRGAFHGACWRIRKQHAIVLKQKNRARSRWMFDALHEFRHTSQHLELDELSIVEEIVANSEDSDEEDANDFAAEVLLGKDVVTIEKECVKESKGKLERLKATVQRVAQTRQIDVGVLANHMAFRLSEQGEDWWGAAHNLQSHHDADQIAREVFVDRFDFTGTSTFERNLIMRAISKSDDL